jgi:hypothetical protein
MPHHKSFGKLRAEVKWKQKGKPRFVNFLGLCCLEILHAKVSSTWASTKQICPCLYSSVVVTKAALDYLHQSPLLLLCHSRLCYMTLRVTLDKDPRSRDQWIQAILMVQCFKWVPRHLDEGPRPKSGKLRLNLHGTCFGGKINQLVRTNKTVLKGELLIWRTKSQARDQGTVQLKDSISSK